MVGDHDGLVQLVNLGEDNGFAIGRYSGVIADFFLRYKRKCLLRGELVKGKSARPKLQPTVKSIR